MLYHDGRPYEQTMSGAEVAMWSCRVWGRVWRLPSGTLVRVTHEGGHLWRIDAAWGDGVLYQGTGRTLQECYRWIAGMVREEAGLWWSGHGEVA
jgi:hypothetical protein